MHYKLRLVLLLNSDLARGTMRVIALGRGLPGQCRSLRTRR